MDKKKNRKIKFIGFSILLISLIGMLLAYFFLMEAKHIAGLLFFLFILYTIGINLIFKS